MSNVCLAKSAFQALHTNVAAAADYSSYYYYYYYYCYYYNYYHYYGEQQRSRSSSKIPQVKLSQATRTTATCSAAAA